MNTAVEVSTNLKDNLQLTSVLSTPLTASRAEDLSKNSTKATPLLSLVSLFLMMVTLTILPYLLNICNRTEAGTVI